MSRVVNHHPDLDIRVYHLSKNIFRLGGRAFRARIVVYKYNIYIYINPGLRVSYTFHIKLGLKYRHFKASVIYCTSLFSTFFYKSFDSILNFLK